MKKPKEVLSAWVCTCGCKQFFWIYTDPGLNYLSERNPGGGECVYRRATPTEIFLTRIGTGDYRVKEGEWGFNNRLGEIRRVDENAG